MMWKIENDNLRFTLIAFSDVSPTMNNRRFLCFHRVIQQSHPVCNTIMLFGVITCLISVILLGIDGQFVDSSTYPKVSREQTNFAWVHSLILLPLISPVKVSHPSEVNGSESNINESLPFPFVYQSSLILVLKAIPKSPRWIKFRHRRKLSGII